MRFGGPFVKVLTLVFSFFSLLVLCGQPSWLLSALGARSASLYGSNSPPLCRSIFRTFAGLGTKFVTKSSLEVHRALNVHYVVKSLAPVLTNRIVRFCVFVCVSLFFLSSASPASC